MCFNCKISLIVFNTHNEVSPRITRNYATFSLLLELYIKVLLKVHSIKTSSKVFTQKIAQEFASTQIKF